MYVHKILGPQKINIPTHSSPFSAFTFLFQYIYPPPISQSLCNLLFLATFFLFVSHRKNKCGMMSIRSGSGRSSNSNDNDDNSRLVVAHHHPPGCFSASQWQELEHQALVFKYMISGIPIPPDLLRTSCSLLHNNTHLNGSWNRFEMGRKIDTEPGRCRRTDGKKWRCSKEAYPDSKYCERHMHRGRNRSSTGTSSSRKQQITPPPPPPPPNPNPIIKNTLPHFLSKYSSGFSSQQDINSYFLHPNYRSNPGSNMVRSSISSTDHNDVDSSSSSSKLTMALMGHSSLFPHAKHNMSTLSSDVARGHKNQQQHQPEKVMHHFLDERSTKDEQGSDSDRTTQLSISIPNYLHDFFITQKCKQRFWEEFESMGEKQSTLRLWWDTSIL